MAASAADPTQIVQCLLLSVRCEENQPCVPASHMHFSDSMLGGALLVQDGDVQLSNSTFLDLQGNSSAVNLLSPNGSSASVFNCSFTNLTTINTNGNQSAALYSTSSPITITSCNFLACNASGTSGGAVLLVMSPLHDGSWPVNPDAKLEDSVFENNTSSEQGGAVYAVGGNALYLYLNYCTFRRNFGIVGGAVAADEMYYMGVVNCLFRQNRVKVGKGGAIYSYGNVQQLTNVLLLNSSFLNNSNMQSGAFDREISNLSYFYGCAGAYFEFGQCLCVYECIFAGNQGVGLAI